MDSVVSGMPAGTGPAPGFDAVGAGDTPLVQAVRVHYRPERIGYKKLLEAYWRNIDPTRADGQFTDDAGPQYRTVIYFDRGSGAHAAEASRKRLLRNRGGSSNLS